MKRRVMTWLLLLAAGYLALCALLYFRQASLLYHPGPPPPTEPAGFEAQVLDLEPAPGVRLHGWWLPIEEADGAVLFLHGNAGNIQSRLAHARAFHAMGLSVLLFDWRGYGRSLGRPEEQGLYQDAEAVWSWMIETRQLAPEQIVLYGESLGGAVAIELATRHRPRALVTEATFTSVPDLAADLFPWLPARWLVNQRYESLDKAPRVTAPWLVIHSPEDDLIPYTHAEALVAAPGANRTHLATTGGHNSGGFLLSLDGRRAVAEFLEAH